MHLWRKRWRGLQIAYKSYLERAVSLKKVVSASLSRELFGFVGFLKRIAQPRPSLWGFEQSKLELLFCSSLTFSFIKVQMVNYYYILSSAANSLS